MLRVFPRREMLSALLLAVLHGGEVIIVQKTSILNLNEIIFYLLKGITPVFLEKKSVFNPCMILRVLVFFSGLTLTG